MPKVIEDREKALRLLQAVQYVGDRRPKMELSRDTAGTPRYAVTAYSTVFDARELRLMLGLADEEGCFFDVYADPVPGQMSARFN